jgi:hypothetical protein
VERVRKVKEKPRFGERVSVQTHKIVAANENRRWQLYVGNLKAGTSGDSVIEYCKDFGVLPMECEVVSNQSEDIPDKPVAVRLSVLFDDRDKIMETAFWPKGVKIRGWRLQRRRR